MKKKVQLTVILILHSIILFGQNDRTIFKPLEYSQPVPQYTPNEQQGLNNSLNNALDKIDRKRGEAIEKCHNDVYEYLNSFQYRNEVKNGWHKAYVLSHSTCEIMDIYVDDQQITRTNLDGKSLPFSNPTRISNARAQFSTRNYLDENEINKVFFHESFTNDPSTQSTNQQNSQAGNHKEYYDKGYEYYIRQDYKNAISYFDKAIELSPTNGLYYYFRGWANNYSDLYLIGIQDFNKIIELYPNNNEGYFGRSYSKQGLGDSRGANKDLMKTIELDPKNSMAYNNLGWYKFESGDLAGALKDVNKSIELDPKNVTAVDSRAEIKFNLKDYTGSLKDCNMAISMNSKMGNTYLIRGKIYQAQGNINKACDEWSLAGENGRSVAYDLIKKYCK